MVTTLTTTGCGDITLPGHRGQAVSILIMIGGVSLGFRLAQVVMRTPKVKNPCSACGLQRHEPDAIHCKSHCKSCGARLVIRYDDE